MKEKLEKYRLSESEYEKICEVLGRSPQGIEWALFSALWSEHCSYKSSKVHLKKLFNHAEHVVEGFGENAGVIDLGHGERVAFKMESHNHPSFIEPYQGAATGVGGILRDIFTMGARPIALANYLCFGDPNADRMPYLVDGVVGGISGYGNCVGVPTITGQTEFHSSYNENILVNALAVGLFQDGDRVFLSKAKGEGNYIVYVGAKTGRDGVHGASMASESFDEDSESKRPTVQIGDPFYEKLLIESCLEVMKENLVVAIQDMGAAGIISSSFEMASKGGVGLKIQLDQVPIRDQSITPEEILLSESQERMLLVCEPRNYKKLQNIFDKWGLDAAIIGEVQNEKTVQIMWNNEELTNMNPDILVENAPQYQRPYSQWKAHNKVKEVQPLATDQSTLNFILNSIQGTNRRWLYEQYDQRVGANTISDCDHSVGVVWLPQTQRALGLVLGCRPYLMRMDAQLGGWDSVLYPALQLAVKGIKPLAVTDCLNFGNPEKNEVMSEFVASLQAMSDACASLNTPIISGNVSLYNETQKQNITPTPSTGMVGLRENLDLPKDKFQSEGDLLYLLKCHQVQSQGQLAELQNQAVKFSGDLNLDEITKFTQKLVEICQNNIVSSRVVGKFGIAYHLARMCTLELGCKVEVEKPFMEKLYEVILVVKPEHQVQFEYQLQQQNLDFKQIGNVQSEVFNINSWKWSLQEINQSYEGGWKEYFSELER